MGASAVLVLTPEAPLTALELKRALIGAASRVVRRLAEPPILKRDMVDGEGAG